MIKKLPLFVLFNKIAPAFWGVLLFEYAFIFLFLFNYDLAWMNPEKLAVEPWILANGSQWQQEDWTKFLNIDVIEQIPDRLSRPISNFVEVVNTKWRAWAWNFMVPHPALSLMWPIMLTVVPFLLYRTFVNMGCYPYVAFASMCIYLSTIGFLSPMVMLFHPAKNLVNLFAALTLFLCSLLYKRTLQNTHLTGIYWISLAVFICLYLGFLSDETGLFVYGMVIILFMPVWLKLWKQRDFGILSGFVILPIIYALTLKVFLPWCHWVVRGRKIDIGTYESYPSIQSLFWPNWEHFWQNVLFLFGEHPRWITDYGILLSHPVLFALQLVYCLTSVFVAFLAVKILIKKPAEFSASKRFFQLAAISILLMIGYCFFHTFQLSRNAKVWGVWWYGGMFSLVYVFVLAFVFQSVCMHHDKIMKWLVCILAVFILHSLVFTTERIAVFKMQNIDRVDYNFKDIFKSKLDGYKFFNFKDSLQRSSCKKLFTYMLWQGRKGHLLKGPDASKAELCQNILKNDFCLKVSKDICMPVDGMYLFGELK